MGDYLARVADAWPNRDAPGHFIVSINCPLCGRRHQHGVTIWDKPHHRTSHCRGETGSYSFLFDQETHDRIETAKKGAPA